MTSSSFRSTNILSKNLRVAASGSLWGRLFAHRTVWSVWRLTASRPWTFLQCGPRPAPWKELLSFSCEKLLLGFHQFSCCLVAEESDMTQAASPHPSSVQNWNSTSLTKCWSSFELINSTLPLDHQPFAHHATSQAGLSSPAAVAGTTQSRSWWTADSGQKGSRDLLTCCLHPL